MKVENIVYNRSLKTAAFGTNAYFVPTKDNRPWNDNGISLLIDDGNICLISSTNTDKTYYWATKNSEPVEIGDNYVKGLRWEERRDFLEPHPGAEKLDAIGKLLRKCENIEYTTVKEGSRLYKKIIGTCNVHTFKELVELLRKSK